MTLNVPSFEILHRLGILRRLPTIRHHCIIRIHSILFRRISELLGSGGSNTPTTSRLKNLYVNIHCATSSSTLTTSGRGLSLRSRPPPTVSTEAVSCPDTKAIYAPHTAGETGERADDEHLLWSFIGGSGAGGCIAFSSSSHVAFTDTNANHRVRTPRSNQPARSLPW